VAGTESTCARVAKCLRASRSRPLALSFVGTTLAPRTPPRACVAESSVSAERRHAGEGTRASGALVLAGLVLHRHRIMSIAEAGPASRAKRLRTIWPGRLLVRLRDSTLAPVATPAHAAITEAHMSKEAGTIRVHRAAHSTVPQPVQRWTDGGVVARSDHAHVTLTLPCCPRRYRLAVLVHGRE